MELPPQADALRRQIDAELERAVAGHVAELAAIHPDVALLADELAVLVLGGGKRLRPLLLLVGWLAAGGRDPGTALGPALAVELVHACALVHDDIIDAAAARRGRDTAHIALARAHRERGWRGSPEAFGTSAAILLGDLALVLADALFAWAARTPGYARAFTAFTQMRVEVTVGQFLDVVVAAREEADPDAALAVAERKSGLYSVARPLEVGALLADRPDVADGLARAGVPLGVAFQLRDDLLGVFGSEEATGKSVLSDLTEGKRTFLVTTALGRLAPADRERFTRLFGDGTLDEDGAATLRALIEQSGARAATETKIAELVAEAERGLDGLRLPADADETLRAVAAFVARPTR